MLGFGTSALNSATTVLPTPSALELLLSRCSYGLTSAEYAQAKIDGFDGWLQKQLTNYTQAEPTLDAEIAQKYPRINATAADLVNDTEVNSAAGVAGGGGFPASLEHIMATLLRRIKSGHQLFEVMCEFWSDNFNIRNADSPMTIYKIIDDREVIRAHALGNFGAMLKASAHSMAMMEYLDNARNVAGTPNENYARELMELHTLGIGNYSETDVKEIARCFTGWTVQGYYEDYKPVFVFDNSTHDNGAKVVLRHKIAAGGGQSDGETVLNILAKHPATQRRIAKKLCQHFISDDPEPRAVDVVAAAYATTNGDIPTMLKTLFATPEFLASHDRKIRRPCNLMTKGLRVTNAVFTSSPAIPNVSVTNIPIAAIDNYMWSLYNWLEEFGNLPYGWAPPDGYPDQLAYWANTGGFLSRMNWGFEVAEDNTGYGDISIDALALIGSHNTPTSMVDYLAPLILQRSLSAMDRTTLINFVANGGSTTAVISDTYQLKLRAQELLGSLLSSAYFNRR